MSTTAAPTTITDTSTPEVTVTECSWVVKVDGKHKGTVHDHGRHDHVEFYATTGTGGLGKRFPSKAEAVAAIVAYRPEDAPVPCPSCGRAVHA